MCTTKVDNTTIMWLIWFSIIFVAFVCIKLLLNYTYWSRKGVAQLQPWPLFGNTGPPIFGIRSFTDVLHNIYNSLPDQRYCGMYNFLRPTLLVRCPDLIKSVTVLEFDTFPEHRLMLPPNAEPLFKNNIVTMTGVQKWRDLRSSLTSCLTGSKLKAMFESMQQCAGKCMAHLEKYEGHPNVNMEKVFSRFANDVSYNTTFGVSCDSFEHPKNEFYLMGKFAANSLPWRTFNSLLNSINPILTKIFHPYAASSRINKFFLTLGMTYIRQAEIDENGHVDVINLLTKARIKNPRVALTDEDIISQAFIFYLGGLNTSIATMCYTIYELAFNPDVQKRLQTEIDKTSDLSYNSISEMKYLDMVISESLRKWPPFTNTDRRALKPFTIEAVLPGEKTLHLDAGTEVWIPIFSLHRDPVHYPEPEKFDPERFNSMNRSNINQYAYLPFGAGPKMCIGSRLGMLKVKVIMYQILRKYDVLPTKKTPTSLVFHPYFIIGAPKGEFLFKLRPRK